MILLKIVGEVRSAEYKINKKPFSLLFERLFILFFGILFPDESAAQHRLIFILNGNEVNTG